MNCPAAEQWGICKSNVTPQATANYTLVRLWRMKMNGPFFDFHLLKLKPAATALPMGGIPVSQSLCPLCQTVKVLLIAHYISLWERDFLSKTILTL